MSFTFWTGRLLLVSSTLFLAGFGLAASEAAEGGSDFSNLRPWTEYRAIMWVGDSAHKKPEKLPLFYQRLREMGINTGMVSGDGDPGAVLSNAFPYYVENIVNRGLCLKWNSQVQDWDKFVTEWAKSGRPKSALVRDYCLDDPKWRQWAENQMSMVAKKNRQHRPTAYDIRDELSTTISANPFDYDFNPITLTAFRGWLKTQYGDLGELNAQWETGFKSWEEVTPFTTDEIKNRMASGQAEPRGKPDWAEVQALRFDLDAARKQPTRWNFSPWADFRSYMDLSLAEALNGMRLAAHKEDPETPVGIEGTQMPHAFGGYDLWRLSQALDWIEPYDIGNTREILGSFMPGKAIMTTVFESDTEHASRRLWHLLLEGDRGCIIWWSEDSVDWNSPDYALTRKAKALAPVLKELASPLGRLFLNSQREYDPVYIHYSQASIQADWLIESTVDGSTWLRRFSSFEADHNRQAHVRNSWLKLFQDLGYSPRFVSTDQIERGALKEMNGGVLVLPTSWAFSDKEGAEITGFLARSGPAQGPANALFWNGVPGVFDQHCKIRPRSVLESLFPQKPSGESGCFAAAGSALTPRANDIRKYETERLRGAREANELTQWAAERLKVRPPITVPAETCTRVHRFKIPNGQLVAFERNINYQMSEELKQAGGNEPLEREISFDAQLDKPGHVYDLRNGGYLGKTKIIRVELNPWRPSLYAVTREKLAGADVIKELAE